MFKRERLVYVNIYYVYNVICILSLFFCLVWFDREYIKVFLIIVMVLLIFLVDGRMLFCWFFLVVRVEEMSSKLRRNVVEFMVKVFDGLNIF